MLANAGWALISYKGRTVRRGRTVAANHQRDAFMRAAWHFWEEEIR
jgi:hypothetical protein